MNQSIQLPVIIIKMGMPSVAQALNKLTSGIKTHRGLGNKVVKVIHGRGASGVGGRIRDALRNRLPGMVASTFIRGFIPGEEFGYNRKPYSQYYNDFPALKKDPDFKRRNPGITIIIIY